jgi:hypothetical protein
MQRKKYEIRRIRGILKKRSGYAVSEAIWKKNALDIRYLRQSGKKMLQIPGI